MSQAFRDFSGLQVGGNTTSEIIDAAVDMHGLPDLALLQRDSDLMPNIFSCSAHLRNDLTASSTSIPQYSATPSPPPSSIPLPSAYLLRNLATRLSKTKTSSAPPCASTQVLHKTAKSSDAKVLNFSGRQSVVPKKSPHTLLTQESVIILRRPQVSTVDSQAGKSSTSSVVNIEPTSSDRNISGRNMNTDRVHGSTNAGNLADGKLANSITLERRSRTSKDSAPRPKAVQSGDAQSVKLRSSCVGSAMPSLEECTISDPSTMPRAFPLLKDTHRPGTIDQKHIPTIEVTTNTFEGGLVLAKPTSSEEIDGCCSPVEMRQPQSTYSCDSESLLFPLDQASSNSTVNGSNELSLSRGVDVNINSPKQVTCALQGLTAQATPSSQDPLAPPATTLDQQERFPAASKRQGNRLRKSPTSGHQREQSGQMQANTGTLQFAEYLSAEEISKGLKAGGLFTSTFRVNAYNCIEAYATLEGVSTDILLFGPLAQNRAMEGDTVVVEVNPAATWPRMRGGKDSESGQNSHLAMAADQQASPSSSSLPHTGVPSTRKAACASRKHVAAHLEGAQCVHSKLDKVSEENGAPAGGASGTKTCDGGTGGGTDSSGEDGDAVNIDESPPYADQHHRSASLAGAKIAAECVNDGLRGGPGRRPSGRVVAILQKSRQREVLVGYLNCGSATFSKATGLPGRHCPGEDDQALLEASLTFTPADPRFPRMRVLSAGGLPDSIREGLHRSDPNLANTLVAGRVTCWPVSSFMPFAVIHRSLGQAGEIEAETAAIVFQHSIHGLEFPEEVMRCLPATPWRISAAEMAQRLDLRDRRIFTIDPPGARDLDDALSIQAMPDGNLQVGVHIADVSSFVAPGTALDAEARRRSTTVYLIQRALPMLPPLLCEQLCSLSPGVDRLAFSLLLDMTADGKILSQWLGRTVIRSCCKLTYGHAQEMIDHKLGTSGSLGGSGESGLLEGVPELASPHQWPAVMSDVALLHTVAQKLRTARFATGALRLDNVKLAFQMDGRGNPVSASPYEALDSNRLVEEFMILANVTVARVLAEAFPDRALLRRHPPPNERKLADLNAFCQRNGLAVDTSSSAALHRSLLRLREDTRDDPAIFDALLLLATKPMQLARYFSTGEMAQQAAMWQHYALAVPFYTHFTSPIRRYADLVVHRALAAALGARQSLDPSPAGWQLSGLCQGLGWATKPGDGPPEQTTAPHSSPQQARGRHGDSTEPIFEQRRSAGQGRAASLALAPAGQPFPGADELAQIAEHCNERRMASKRAQEASNKLYLCIMLKRLNGVLSDGCIVALGPKFLTVFVQKFGLERNLYYDSIPGVKAEWFAITRTLLLACELPTKKSSPARGTKLLSSPSSSPILKKGASWETRDMQDEEEPLRMGEASLYREDLDHQEDEGGMVEEVHAIEPVVLPLTLRVFSAVPVWVYAIGGDDRPLDVAVKLHMTSYAAVWEC